MGNLSPLLVRPVHPIHRHIANNLTFKLLTMVVIVPVVVLALVFRPTFTITLMTALAFGVALLAGVTIIYSFLLILATCAFWWVRLDNILNTFRSMYEAGRWPIGIYPPWLRGILTFLVPVGFAITVPTEGLVGRLTSPTLLGAIALPLIARAF